MTFLNELPQKFLQQFFKRIVMKFYNTFIVTTNFYWRFELHYKLTFYMMSMSPKQKWYNTIKINNGLMHKYHE